MTITRLKTSADYIEVQQCDLDLEEALREAYAINGPVVSLIAQFREEHSPPNWDEVREALEEARRLCEQVPIDLSSAHAEICKLQGLDPKTHSWPDWTPQANTLRWLENKLVPMLDAALAKEKRG